MNAGYVVTLGIAHIRSDGQTEEVCHSHVTPPVEAKHVVEHFDNYLFILCSNRMNKEQAAEVKGLVEAAD